MQAVQLELTDAQQRLRLAEQASAEARADFFRLKQEQHEDSRATEVRPHWHCVVLCQATNI